MPENNHNDEDKHAAAVEAVPENNHNDEDKHTAAVEAVQEARTNFALFHFALTAPKYSISLFLFLAAGCIPLTTPNEGIHRPISELYQWIQAESDSYVACTKNAFARAIHSDLQVLAQEELERVQEAQEENQQLIEGGRLLSQTYWTAASTARKSIQTWRAFNGIVEESMNNGTCSEKDRSFLASFLAEDSAILIEGEITSIVEEYVESTTKSLDHIQSYADKRLQYDYNYFVSSRINPTLEVLEDMKENMFGGSSFNFLIDTMDVHMRLADSLKGVATLLEKAEAHIEELQLRMKDYANSVEHLYTSYKDIYQRLVDGAEFVMEFLPAGSDLPDIFDLTAVPRGASLLPDFYHYPIDDFVGSSQEILDETAERCLELLEDIAAQVQRQATYSLRGSANGIADRLSALLSLDDYDPPSFQGSHGGIDSVTGEVDELESLGVQTQERAKAALDYLQPLLNSSNPFKDDLSMDSAAKDWNESSSSFAEDTPTTTFEYLQPEFPSVSIPEVLVLLFSWILSNAWIVEVIVQAIRLWALEAKYSNGAIPDLPTIDYEDDAGREEEDRKDDYSTLVLLLKTALSAFASPGYLAVLTLIPLCFGVMIMWRPHVTSSCQDTNHGTYLANHFLAPLLINKASAAGNTLYMQGEMECRVEQRSVCDEMQLQVGAVFQSDVATLHTLSMRRNESLEAIRAMESCIDLDVNEQQMDESCCGLKGFESSSCQETSLICPMDESGSSSSIPTSSFRPLKEYFAPAAYHGSDISWELNDARFNCSVLAQPCATIPCSGVNEEYILSKTIQTDCKVELYILDCCSFLLMVAYHMFAVNLICTMLFQGSRHLFWRKLCPNGIRLHTHLREDGTLALGDDRADRSKRVLKAIKRFQLIGKVKIAIGIIVLVGWISSLVIFRHFDIL
eukprot:scaffold2844_cov123-Cylindrotheca_fusiformis.AAC.10